MRVSNRLLLLLEGVPHGFPTPALVRLCGQGLASPRSTVWAHLRRLEKFGRVRRHRGRVTRWQSTRWEVQS